MTAEDYPPGYWTSGEGSNYHGYGDDPGWATTLGVIKRYVPLPAALYEMGAAMGYFIRQAREAGYEAHGIDISPYAVHRVLPGIKPYVILGNALNSPYGASSADIVATWEFLEHVPEDELPAMLDEIERVLKPTGWVWSRIGMDDSDATHVTIKPREWWEAQFEFRGWEHQPRPEIMLDAMYPDRDWAGRFFVWRFP